VDSFNDSVELVRITFLFGAVLAMLYKKYTGITPGGIIVPAFLALILDRSFEWFSVILAISVVCTVLYKLLFSFLALTRHWTVIINIAMGAMLTLGLQYLMGELLPFTDITAFGFVLPGLIASANYYQHPLQVAKATLSVTAVTYSFGWLLYSIIPYAFSSKLAVQLASFEPVVISHPYIAIPVSLISVAISYRYFNARSGGYLIAPIVSGLAATSLAQFGLFLAGVIVVYALVNLLLKYSLVIGLERFVFILFLSTAIVTTIDMYAITTHMHNYRAAPLITIIAMAVWVNDLCLQPIKKSAGGGFSVPLASSLELIRVMR
jgi:hypothetical protein